MQFQVRRFWFRAVAVGLSFSLLSQNPSLFSSPEKSNQSHNIFLAPSSFASIPTRVPDVSPDVVRESSRRRGSSVRAAIGALTSSTVAFLAVLFGGSFTETSFVHAQDNSTPPQTTNPDSPNESERFQVVNVVDGDTIDVLIDGREERVRLIGIDTPEVFHCGEEVVSREYLGAEAAQFCRSLIEAGGGRVRLEADPNLTDRCDYGRLLRYVWVTLPDPDHEGETHDVLLNLKLLEEGYAEVFWRSIRQMRYSHRFLDARTEARARSIGIWDREASRSWRSKKREEKEKQFGGILFSPEAENIFSSV